MKSTFRTLRIVPLAALLLATPAAVADVDYSLTDHTSEIAFGIDNGESMVWLDTFPVDPLGAYVDTIRVAYGRPGGPSPINGQNVKILLYEDQDGGDPKNARLLWSFDTKVANGNTNTLNSYAVPPTFVRAGLVVGVYYRNTNPVRVYIGAVDTTAPSLPDRSYTGWAVTLDPANLGAIPAAQWGTLEASGTVGNFVVDAHARPTPDGILLSAVERVPAGGLVRLTFSGTKASYDVQRASRPDFADGAVVGAGVTGPIWDDAVLDDGRTWFYLVR